MQGKKCNNCGEIKPLSEFHRVPQAKDGYRLICKVCRRKELKDWRDRAREKENTVLDIKGASLTEEFFLDRISDFAGATDYTQQATRDLNIRLLTLLFSRNT